MSEEKVCCQKGECAILKGFEDKIAELESKFKESEKNTDDWTIKVDKKYKELEQKIEKINKSIETDAGIEHRIRERLEKLELAIKNSPPNSHLKQEISKLKKEIYENMSSRFEIEINKRNDIKSVLNGYIKANKELAKQLNVDVSVDHDKFLKQLDRGDKDHSMHIHAPGIMTINPSEKPSRVYMWVCPECEEDTYFPIKCDKCTSHHLDSKPSSIIMKGRERWAGKGWIKKNILGIEEKPSRCEKCGSSLVMDIATLNKGDPFCPKCFPNKKQPSSFKHPSSTSDNPLPYEPSTTSKPSSKIKWVCKECGYSGNSRDIVCPECHNSLFKRQEEKPSSKIVYDEDGNKYNTFINGNADSNKKEDIFDIDIPNDYWDDILKEEEQPSEPSDFSIPITDGKGRPYYIISKEKYERLINQRAEFLDDLKELYNKGTDIIYYTLREKWQKKRDEK